MTRQQLLYRLEEGWQELMNSWANLPDPALTEPGVVGDWSVKDILGHVTTWEEETLKALPRIMQGVRAPRYGDIDRFNAQGAALKRDLTHGEVLRQLAETHQRLVAFLVTVPESYLAGETRFRRRLRSDTYGHYPEHTASILAWRRARRLSG